MNVQQLILKKIEDGTFALCTDEQIARKLHLKKREALALREMLHDLVREGKLFSDSRYRYGTLAQFGAKKGEFRGNERGFGFFVPEDGSCDLFLPRNATKGALHGDTVYAIPVESDRSDDEGEVLSVVERGYKEIVGTFYLENRQSGYLHPDERRFTTDIYIPVKNSKGCKDGFKAIARITSYPEGRSPGGEIIEILGDGEDFFVEELSLIRAHNLRESFSDELLNLAEKEASRAITESDLKGRVDLRKELIITIDGEDTRDIDDAVSVSEENGIYHLGVHIADVSHYVRRGEPLDEEAFARGTSVYFPDRVLPMLPPALSNGICSLNEGVDRLTLSCFMTIDRKGHVLSRSVAPSVIRSRHRMTYTDVTAISEGDKEALSRYPDLKEFVDTAVALTKILQKTRDDRGSIAMDIKEAHILYRDGEILIPDHKRTISHEMIEQFMVLANESVASLMTEKGFPFVYRVHERPAEEKAQAFHDFLVEIGVHAKFDPDDVSPADYQQLLKELDGSPAKSVANRVMLRSMMKAKYSPENVGHFGLASACYCHFTSPIRRYPDLVVHRIVKQSLVDPKGLQRQFGTYVGQAAAQSSSCEKNAAEAERDVDSLYCVAYMQDRIGEEYDATVSGVTSRGVYAELDNAIEGFIDIAVLPSDSYDYIEEKFLLKGIKNTFRLGDRIRVQTVGVDWGLRRTQFLYLRHIPTPRV